MTPPFSPTQAYHARLAGRWVASVAHVLAAHTNQEIKISVFPGSVEVQASPYFDIGPHLTSHERMALASRLPHAVGQSLFGGIAHGVEQTFHLTGYGYNPAASYLMDDGKGQRVFCSLGGAMAKNWSNVAAFWGITAALLDPCHGDPFLAKALGSVYVDVTSTFPNNAVALCKATHKAIDAMGGAPNRAHPVVRHTKVEHAMRVLPRLDDLRACSRLKALAESAIPAAWEHAQAGFAQGPLGPS